MILEYHRPRTISEALNLIARPNPKTLPLGGGTILNRPNEEDVAVVDLQSLGLNTFERQENLITAGAVMTLQNFLEKIPDLKALAEAVHLECPLNLRNMATLGGTIACGDGRSPLLAALLGLDAKVTLLPGDVEVPLGELLSQRGEKLKGRLIARIHFSTQEKMAFETVARSPVDRPILMAFVSYWSNQRTRVVIGGFGPIPQLVSDGEDEIGLETAARILCSRADDEWAGSRYRQDAVGALVHRCLEQTRGI